MNYAEITNPSDPYTICIDDIHAARIAVLVLGNGAYTIRGDSMPFFFGGSIEAWWKQDTGVELKSYMDSHATAIATALRSVLVGNLRERREVEAATRYMPLEKQAEYVADYKDQKRTSMNDIGKRAEVWAEAFERRAASRHLAEVANDNSTGTAGH